MKRRLLVALLLITQLTTVAQKLKNEFNINKGELFKVGKGDVHFAVTPNENGNFYALERDGKDLLMHEFNADLKKVNTAEYELKYDKDRHYFKDLIVIKNKLYLFTTQVDNKNKRNKLFVREIDQNTLREQTNFTEICSINFDGESKRNSGGFLLRMSNDSSKLLVYEHTPADNKNPLTYNLTLLDLDNNFKLLWETKYESDKIGRLENVERISVTNGGNAYILAVRYDDKRVSKRKGKPNYSYELRQYTKDKSVVKKTTIDLNDEFITDMQIGNGKEDQIICTGFYSSEGTFSIKGAYYIVIDENTMNKVKESKKEFEIDFITSYMKKNKAKKAKKKKEKGKDVELYEYDLDDLIMRDDGGVIQLAEQYYVTSHTYTDSQGNTYTRFVYHYNNIIAISISPEGEIEWSRKIPKQQQVSSPSSPFVSYYSDVLNNKIFFFYLDNPKNLLVDEKEKISNWRADKKAGLMVYELNSEGFKRKDVLIEFLNDKTIIAPREIVQNSNGELLMFGKDDKKARYYKVSLK